MKNLELDIGLDNIKNSIFRNYYIGRIFYY